MVYAVPSARSRTEYSRDERTLMPRVVIGRYELFDEIAAGGMATVHLGRLVASAGFSRLVAIKRLHPLYAREPDFVSMLLDEARLASRIRHPNVVAMIDVVSEDKELCLVMEYVHATSLSVVLRAHGKGKPVPPRVALTIVTGLLHGLQAAHEATTEKGEPLRIVHRDVSPQNILVGRDGVPRVVDFGIAKASVQLHTTREGTIKGKLAYMAPEQVDGAAVDARTDVYSASVVLWECLTGKRLFQADNDAALMKRVLAGADASSVVTDVGGELAAILQRGLARDPAERFASAQEMALEIEHRAGLATASEVGRWIEEVVGEQLRERELLVQEIERRSAVSADPTVPDPRRRAAKETPPPAPEPPAKLAARSDAATNDWAAPPPDTRVSLGHDVPLPASAPARRGRWTGVAAGVLAVIVVGTLAGRRLLAGKAATAPASSPPSAQVSVPPVTSLAAPAPAESVVSVEDLPPAPAASSAPAAPPPPTAVRPPRPSRCDPPFTVDADGIRRVKPGCGQTRSP